MISRPVLGEHLENQAIIFLIFQEPARRVIENKKRTEEFEYSRLSAKAEMRDD